MSTNGIETAAARKIYFGMLAIAPRLLYNNYFENGKLLAQWLGLTDPWAYAPSGYLIQQTSIQLAMDEEEVAAELAAAMVNVNGRNPS